VIVDASVVIDAVADAGPRGEAARRALAEHPASEPLIAPGHFAFEVMSGLRAAANRPQHPFQPEGIEQALLDAEQLEVSMDAVSWVDVHRAWGLSSALRYADAIYVACAERHGLALLTSDARIARSGAPVRCEVITVTPES
jgi:predicted nucleic acid-binding protein